MSMSFVIGSTLITYSNFNISAVKIRLCNTSACHQQRSELISSSDVCVLKLVTHDFSVKDDTPTALCLRDSQSAMQELQDAAQN